ncbi:zinc metallochaperone AztD [Nocardioides sp. SOB77]|uniref:Zinc metallochaperone AztD n=1 Tax=Nocardioides oceani TaxID=3058369 RepID=A0ABT8FK61_9ACTN|nr:zinc metallochaperone AztD [Nocardioides oceani]MDN4174924.1 zinc metallochaperone AztD [Nocardioides oceani]
MLRQRTLLVLPLLAPALIACGADPGPGGDPAARSSAEATPTPTAEAADAVEEAGPQPRVAVSYAGGVLVLDPATGDVLLDEPLDGYVRLNPAGDGRHAFVSAAGAFTALDLGSWTEAHGDHGHSWSTDPALTSFTVPAEEPGHAVAHDGLTTLFDDGTGQITVVDPFRIAEGEDPVVDTTALPEAHHGVAAQEADGTLLHTVGDAESRSGVRVVTSTGAELAASDECPGVHGEAFAGDVAVVGCEDGVLVVDGRRITKVASPDDYGRIGNQAGHETSPFVLGDYKTDADAELERPTRVAVVDTRDASLRLVDLPASYSFRSLGRTEDGDGLVLGTDGALHVVDVRRAKVSRSIPVVGAWREPQEWQEARPTLRVVGETAYVTEPARDRLHVVDLATGEVVVSHRLPHTPDEVVATAG